ncbi:hypothetical protein DPPB49 [Desulfotalea psychrophila LSv54]|uniref:Uncharacterized protein n=1 Tax=Desulfotalea psychrophila (strain LSv54 / DSM 12343) TaxID=177439 RepID=Q6AID4_DESPS|nr:hypothetical protein DPPB49 [Desulfotalea psychrophila LSv54]
MLVHLEDFILIVGGVNLHPLQRFGKPALITARVKCHIVGGVRGGPWLAHHGREGSAHGVKHKNRRHRRSGGPWHPAGRGELCHLYPCILIGPGALDHGLEGKEISGKPIPAL